MTQKDSILLEDLYIIQTAKNNAVYMRALAEKAVAEEKQAELQASNILLRAYLKYGLSGNDKIDKDGNIIRGDEQINNADLKYQEKIGEKEV